jgi:uncharacterized protein (DUF1499 family)
MERIGRWADEGCIGPAGGQLLHLMKLILYSLCGLLALLLIVARFGLFAGQPPSDLGVADGRLKAPSLTPNSVSSQAALYAGHPQAAYAQIAPIALLNGDGPGSMRALAKVLTGQPDIRLVTQRPDYLQAEATTRWLRFVDDLEFWFNPQAGVIEVRSASRLGRQDFGVNRQRLERIRAAYLAQAKP